MSKYIDGFVLPISKKNLQTYRRMSQGMGKLMKKYGALEYIEAVGDDLSPRMMGKMKFVKFPQMAKAKTGENVIFSFIIFKSRAHRDKVNAKVMKDPMMNDPKWKDKPMPFDMKKMTYGGFKVFVEE